MPCWHLRALHEARCAREQVLGVNAPVPPPLPPVVERPPPGVPVVPDPTNLEPARARPRSGDGLEAEAAARMLEAAALASWVGKPTTAEGTTQHPGDQPTPRPPLQPFSAEQTSSILDLGEPGALELRRRASALKARLR